MKTEPRPADADRTVREKLLEAATDLFNRKGYASTTVREIVEAAGVTKPVLYYYFGNKEGIYLDLMGSAFQSFDRLLEELGGQTGTVRERILRLADGSYELFQQHTTVIRLMHSIYYGPPQGAPFFDFEAYHRKFECTVERYLSEGIRRGEFRKGLAREGTWAVIGAVNTAMELELCHPEMALGRAGLRRVLLAIFEGIGAKKDGARGRGRNRAGKKGPETKKRTER